MRPKKPAFSKWVNAGYELFCKEGQEGIQIERLARITSLNKSGFYHYFYDLDGFFEALMSEHENRMDQIAAQLFELESYDPDFLKLIAQNKSVFFFHIQLVKNKQNSLFRATHTKTNAKLDKQAQLLFAKDLGLNEEASSKYHDMVRDLFFTRAEFYNLTYEFLHQLFLEIKETARLLQRGKN